MAAIRRKIKSQQKYHEIAKLTVINRLEQAGKFNDALSALKADDLLYEKWSAVSVIRSDDAHARGLFSALGLDPDVILAR